MAGDAAARLWRLLSTKPPFLIDAAGLGLRFGAGLTFPGSKEAAHTSWVGVRGDGESNETKATRWREERVSLKHNW